MITPKEIANKIKQDAQLIQDTIKTRSGLDISTKQLTKIADTLLNDCKNGSQENHLSHVKRAISHTHQAIDGIVTEFDKKCQQKQIMNLAKQEIKLSLSDLKTKLQTIQKDIDNNRAHHNTQHGSQPLNKNQMKSVFGNNLKTPPQLGKKDTSHNTQPRRK